MDERPRPAMGGMESANSKGRTHVAQTRFVFFAGGFIEMP